MEPQAPPRGLLFGIRANSAQLALLVIVNVLVGAFVGQSRTIVPLLGIREFDVGSTGVVLAFVVAFGFAKSLSNLAAGALADPVGRRRLLIVGWSIGLPVPLLLFWAPDWSWVILANIVLGISQGLTWSMTLMMKLDVSGSRARGFAAGLNESAGYIGVAVSALVSGLLAARYGLRPPLLLGVIIVVIGLALSVLARDTGRHVASESAQALPEPQRLRDVLALVSFRHRALAAVSRAGMINNATDAVAWGVLPIVFAQAGLGASDIGLLAALYTGTWGVGQLVTGALSDRAGRRWPMVAGMTLQSLALASFLLSDAFAMWAVSSVIFGLGTALVYPVALAAVGDLVSPASRARVLGAYRFWRDAGYVVGGVAGALVADRLGLGISGAVGTAAIAAGASALDLLYNMPSRPDGPAKSRHDRRSSSTLEAVHGPT